MNDSSLMWATLLSLCRFRAYFLFDMIDVIDVQSGSVFEYYNIQTKQASVDGMVKEAKVDAHLAGGSSWPCF